MNIIRPQLSLIVLGLGVGAVASALESLPDNELAAVTGEGIALVLEDFRFQMRNTGNIEQTGTDPGVGAGYQRGDLRWYGLTISGAGAADGLGWKGEACGHALCPLSNTGATLAPFDNPYLLRVFDKTGFDFQNNQVTKTVLEMVGPTASDPYRWSFWGEVEVGKSGATNDALLQSQTLITGRPVVNDTVRESSYVVSVEDSTTVTTVTSCGFLCTNHTKETTTTTTEETYVNNVLVSTSDPVTTTTTSSGSGNGGCGGSGTPRTCTTTSSTSAQGPTTTTENTVRRGTLFRVFQNQDNADRSVGMTFSIALSGDFRFSLAQTAGSDDALGVVPEFDNGTGTNNAPGLIFRNVNSWIPLGQLFYQSLILDDTVSGGSTTAGDGNFVIELTRLPNQANAYNDFYSLPGLNGGTGEGCTDARYQGQNCGYQRTARPSRYHETHGFVRWGDWYPGNGANCGAAGTLCNSFAATDDGFIFIKATAASTFTATATQPDTSGGYNDPPPTITRTRTGLSAVNLGDGRIEGLLIQHLKITSLGAGP